MTGLDHQRVRFWSSDKVEGTAASLDNAAALVIVPCPGNTKEEHEEREGRLAITLSLLGSAVTEVMEPSAVVLLRDSTLTAIDPSRCGRKGSADIRDDM